MKDQLITQFSVQSPVIGGSVTKFTALKSVVHISLFDHAF